MRHCGPSRSDCRPASTIIRATKCFRRKTVELAELQAALRPGEGYYKLMVVGDALYALTSGQQAARALKLGTTASAMAGDVTALGTASSGSRMAKPSPSPSRSSERGRCMSPCSVRSTQKSGPEASGIRAGRTDAAAAAFAASGHPGRASMPIRRGPPGPMPTHLISPASTGSAAGANSRSRSAREASSTCAASRRAGRGRPISGLAKMLSPSRAR